MSIEQDVLKPTVPAFVELFEIDLSTTNIAELVGVVLYFTPMELTTANISFGGTTYVPYPLKIEGISQSNSEAPARPKLLIANINKYFGTLSFEYNDIIGTSVTYIRTFEPYLNTSNRFSLPPMKFVIAKKLLHNKQGMSFELRSPLDKERSYMPREQMLKKDYPGLGVNKRVS